MTQRLLDQIENKCIGTSKLIAFHVFNGEGYNWNDQYFKFGLNNNYRNFGSAFIDLKNNKIYCVLVLPE